MSIADVRALMHAVLDGEATPDERAALERLLRADAAARAEFDALQSLCSQLDALTAEYPPEGLVARVSAALPHRSASQLSGAHRVFGEKPETTRLARFTRRAFMPEHNRSFFGSRKPLIAAGITLAAAAVVWQFGFDSWPLKQDVAGTVMPAQRYRAAQTEGDIKLGDQSLAQLMQNDAFMRMVRDPEVQKLLADPGFVEAARAMREAPDATKQMLERRPAMEALVQAPDAMRVMAVQSEAFKAVERVVVQARALRADAEAERLVRAHAELERYLQLSSELELFSVERLAMDKAAMGRFDARMVADRIAASLVALQRTGEMAQRLAKSAELAQFFANNRNAAQLVQSGDLAARMLKQGLEAGRALGADAQRVYASQMEAALVMLREPMLARVMASDAGAARTLVAHAEVAQRMMLQPEAGRLLLADPGASLRVIDRLAAGQAAADKRSAP